MTESLEQAARRAADTLYPDYSQESCYSDLAPFRAKVKANLVECVVGIFAPREAELRARIAELEQRLENVKRWIRARNRPDV